jgi:acetate---CoA ligase (ADP-forming) subunit beta
MINANQILEKARAEARTALTEIESKELMKIAGIPVAESRLARDKQEAGTLSKEMGFPVVMKIVSPDIIHKTDSGGVKLNIGDAEQAEKAFAEIIAAANKHIPGAKITGVSVQKMATPGIEVIIGMTRDPQFGPVIMFGLGGVMVEVMKDVSFRIVPLSPKDAREMITEIKGHPLLTGYRGSPPADIKCLEDLLQKVSAFAGCNPAVKEIDLNPVIVYPSNAIAVDARVILTGN